MTEDRKANAARFEETRRGVEKNRRELAQTIENLNRAHAQCAAASIRLERLLAETRAKLKGGSK